MKCVNCDRDLQEMWKVCPDCSFPVLTENVMPISDRVSIFRIAVVLYRIMSGGNHPYSYESLQKSRLRAIAKRSGYFCHDLFSYLMARFLFAAPLSSTSSTIHQI